MLVTVRSLSCVYPLRSCEAGVELTDTVNGITRIVEQLKVPVPKAYDSISPALTWEVAKILAAAGFDVVIPPEPESGVLPDPPADPLDVPEVQIQNP